MKRKRIFIVIPLIIILLVLLIWLIQFIRIKTAKIEVTLVNDLNVEFASKVKVSDFITSINGKIIDDYEINTTKLGSKEVEFKFINDDNIKVKYTYSLNIVDTTAPLIWMNDTYSVEKDSDINLAKKILCGDVYDNKPNCYIEGDYDLSVVGTYNLTFKAIDKSKNESSKDFVLNVYEPVEDEEETEPEEEIRTDFNDILKTYKTSKSKVGVDVSKWQGEIDYKKLKDAGVDFVMIRIGGTRGKDAEYFVDEQFENNIKSANKYNIPVGVYFYSYAYSNKEAVDQAKWIMKKIKKYKVDLPIAFDWEEWGNFNEYNLSFFGLTSMAESFVKTVEDKGYKGMIYSSKNYLENMWMPTNYNIWLAHYTDKTNYDGKYKMWQICSNGKVDGINAPVDIDIWYE